MSSVAGFWWRTVPAVVGRGARIAGLGLADGAYLAGQPVAGALAPPAALLVGLAIGKLHLGGDPGAVYTFSYSLPAMAVMLMIAVVGAGLGVWMVLGYMLGDLILTPPPAFDPTSSIVEMALRDQVPLLLSYLFLAQLLVVIPLLTTLSRRSLPSGLGAARGVLGSVLGFPVLGVLVYLWTQAVPTLIRPVYTWYSPDGTPPVAAVAPLQETGWVLILVAGAALVLRIALEATVPGRNQELSFSAVVASPSNAWPIVGAAPVRALLRAGLVTFLLAGVIEAPAEAVVVLVTLAVVFWVRDLVSRASGDWARLISRVPLVLRLLIGIAITFLVASPLINAFWDGTFSGSLVSSVTFVPVLISAVVGLAVFAILLPRPPGRAKQ